MKKFSLLIFVLLAATITLTTCKKDEKENDIPDKPMIYTDGKGEIGPAGGKIIVEDATSPINGAFIEIPQGAVSQATQISMSIAPQDLKFPLDSLATIIKFEPDGLVFEKPVIIGIPFVQSENISNLEIFHYDPDSVTVTQMPKTNLDVTKKIITGETMHFSYYTVADGSAMIDIEMLKIGNRIGLRLKLKDLDKIRTSFFYHNATGIGNVWQSIKLDYGTENSIFRVRLYRHRNYWSDPQESLQKIRVRRQIHATFAADARIYIGPDDGVSVYRTADNLTQNGPSSELAMWNSGEPLIFLFDDFEPNEAHKYYAKIQYCYNRRNQTSILSGRVTPLYEFHNKEVSKQISEMTPFPVSQVHESGALDKSYILESDKMPIAAFTANTTSGVAPLTVNFTDQSSNNPTSWAWDFGDGTTSTQRNPSKTYNASGTYTVVLTATNSHGSDTETKTNFISVTTGGGGDAPVAAFTATPTSGTAPLTVNFTDQSTNNPVSWQWNFGDGSTSTQQNPQHTYQNAGTYTVSLAVTNSHGSDTETKTNYIEVTQAGSAPEAAFTASTTSGTAPLTVNFTDQSTNNPTSWAWNFGDGNSSTQQNPQHTYQNAGTYTVALTVTNSHGSDTETKTNYISLVEVGENDVYNPATGKVWMDRNLGASRVATSSADAEAYGDLYQWGRLTDGHQNRTSGTTSTLSSGDVPGHGDFIIGSLDWRSPQNNNLWQGVNGTNNPCPSGYRLPTDAELNAERQSWSSNNAAGAFSSPLKLPVAGYRDGSNGSLGYVGSGGLYWSATVGGTHARYLYFGSSNAHMGSYYRASGYLVRCLKD